MEYRDATQGVILWVVTSEAQAKAINELRETSAAFLAARDELEERRRTLVEAIKNALRLDVPPSVVERESPYDRQHIGRIRRDAGIPPRRPPTVVSVRRIETTDRDVAAS